jgi:hypothetical protein
MLNKLAPSHHVLGQGIIGPFRRINDTVHDESHTLAIYLPASASVAEPPFLSGLVH